MAKPRSPKKNITPTGASQPVPSPENVAVASAPVLSPAEPEVKTTEPYRTIRKPEIVKTDGRANLVPINLEDEVRQLAYLFSERRGFVPGYETEDWLAAEREVRQRYRQHSA